MYRELWTLSLVLLTAGLAAGLASVWCRYRAQRNAPYSGFAEARVVDIVAVPREGEDSRSEFRNRIAAVFEFYAGGHPVKVTDRSAVYPCPYHMNDRVRLCYDPEDPQRFQVIQKNRLGDAATACGVLAVLLVLAGCAVFLLYARRNQVT